MPARPITVAVSSDQEIVRLGVVALLQAHADRFAVLEPAEDGVRAQVVVHDVTGGSADEPQRLIELVRSGVPVVAVSPATRPDLAHQALTLGATASVPLAVGPTDLAAAVESAATVPARPGRSGAPAAVPSATDGFLTAREEAVVRLVAQGLSNQQIAALLFLSINSVKTYIRTSYRKMGVTSRSQAVLWALRHGLS